MSAREPLAGWYPLMRARSLRTATAMRTLAGTGLRLQRTQTGRVDIRETGSGAHRAAREVGGWVFAALGAPGSDDLVFNAGWPRAGSHLHLDGRVRAGLCDVAENILDTTHTSVVHRNYLRRPGERRPVDARVETGDGWVSATYPPGAAPGGWGARLIGARSFTITDTFRAPGVADVVYADQKAAVFAARFRLTPVNSSETYVAATLAVPDAGWTAALKLAALRLFFLRIFAEDRAILELIETNRAAHGAAPLAFSPQDVLRPGIDAILAGRAARPLPTRIALKV